MSMYTKYVVRKPGNHHEIVAGRFDYVPRQGELVAMDEVTRTVHSVLYDLTTNLVTVYLDP